MVIKKNVYILWLIIIVMNIAIFASGSGTNAENIINYFANNKFVNISLILSNKKEAYVLERAKNHSLASFIFNKNQFYNSTEVLDLLKKKKIDFIVLAGFMWLVPENLIKNYPSKIINIHPALLPKYGGKGMYGNNVHKAVVENKERESGITIHFVNEHYDDGTIIFQAKCEVEEFDTFEDVANKIHLLEYEHFPKIIEHVIKGR